MNTMMHRRYQRGLVNVEFNEEIRGFCSKYDAQDIATALNAHEV